MEYKEAFERIKTYCNSDNGYPYNQYVQSCDPRNEDLKVIEKALEDYSDIKSKIENKTLIEVPCTIDNVSAVIVNYRDCGDPLYAIVQYYCQQKKPLKILRYSIVGKELLKNEDKRVWDWYPSMNFSRIEDGFKTEEEAKARLKELQENKN